MFEMKYLVFCCFLQSPKSGDSLKDKKVRKVNQFQLKCWPKEQSLPEFKHALIGLIDLVERSQLKTGNGPIVVHCQ